MLSGSVKVNVLPIEAVATVNFRIHPHIVWVRWSGLPSEGEPNSWSGILRTVGHGDEFTG